MANYKIVSNVEDVAKLFGGKKELEILLKSMNYGKEIAIELGKEYNPPITWQEFSKEFLIKLADRIVPNLRKDINWKPTEEIVTALRQDLKEIMEKDGKGKMCDLQD